MLIIACPGQGSIKHFFLKEWLQIQEINNEFKKVSKELNLDLIYYGTKCNDNELFNTKISQTLTIATSIIIYEYISKYIIDLTKTQYILGHSAGEVTGLYIASNITKNDAINIAYNRGLLMNNTIQNIENTKMCAVIGSINDEVLNVINKYNLIPANYNGYKQLVVGGLTDDIDNFINDSIKYKIRAKEINVAAAFHTKYMYQAEKKFKDYINKIDFKNKKLKIPIIQNINGKIIDNVDLFINNFINQITKPIRWDLCIDTIKTLQENNQIGIIELAPGNILTNILKQNITNINILTINNCNSLNEVKDFVTKYI